jgi:VCBS repeat-containing protein
VLDSLVALVTDTQNRPVAGATVEFVLAEDRGGGTVSPASVTTNAAGEARAAITLGSEVGEMTGQAQIPVAQGATPIAAGFTAMVLPDDANGISMVSGDGQSGPVGSTLAAPLVVKVTDAFGNPIPGVTVQWSAEGQGSVSETSTITGADGQTSVSRILGPNAGPHTTLASADGLAGSPVTFTSTAAAGSASRIEIVSGNNQTAVAGSELPQDLVVRLLDQAGNPIVNQPVSWVIGAGGGSAIPQTSQTDSEGKATTRWTLGPAAGNNTLNAVVSGVGLVTFSATATSTTAQSSIAITSDQPDPSSVGQEVRVEYSVTAGSGTPTGNVTVTVNGGPESCTGTVASGFCMITLNTAGNRRLTATYSGDGQFSGSSDNEDHRVDQPNLPPIAAPDQYTTDEDVVLNVDRSHGVLVNDADLETRQLTAIKDSDPTHGTLTLNGDGSFSYTPEPNYSGPDSFTYHASDGTASSSIVTVTLTINPINDPPVALDDAFTTPGAGAALTVPAPGVLLNDGDVDGPAGITAQNPSDPAHGSVTLSPFGDFTYTPDPGATGSDQFTYQVTDGASVSTATVTITINP